MLTDKTGNIASKLRRVCIPPLESARPESANNFVRQTFHMPTKYPSSRPRKVSHKELFEARMQILSKRAALIFHVVAKTHVVKYKYLSKGEK